MMLSVFKIKYVKYKNLVLILKQTKILGRGGLNLGCPRNTKKYQLIELQDSWQLIFQFVVQPNM